MSKLIHINNEYAEWVKSLSQRFRQSQIKAAVKVNSEMLKYYWSLGRDIVAKDAVTKWGDKIFITLSADLKDALPGVSGLSVRNLQYMSNCTPYNNACRASVVNVPSAFKYLP